jgi:hypothetical protein
MKKAVHIVVINMLILIGLLAILEIVLRAAGMRPIYQGSGSRVAKENQYAKICAALKNKEKITVYPTFFTDHRGIFRATAGPFPQRRARRENEVRINSSGFRGNEFTFTRTDKPKIFFVGDSFTWGAAAEPIEESFVDQVGRAGYHVYNGGIPGTDPQQYARLAEIYVPLLRPDVTAVCLYLGNDLRNHARPFLANKSLQFSTSVGFIRGYDDRGNYFRDAEQAIDYLKKNKCGCTDNLGDMLLYKTIIGKALYRLSHLPNHLKIDPQRRWVAECLERIGRVCLANRSRFLLFLIPHKNPKKNQNNLKLVASFPGITYLYPENFVRADYCPDPDNHFNNQGHCKFARFIMEILMEKGYPPVL